MCRKCIAAARPRIAAPRTAARADDPSEAADAMNGLRASSLRPLQGYGVALRLIIGIHGTRDRRLLLVCGGARRSRS